MNAALANFINSAALIGLGVWGYFDYSGEKASPTALIPAVFGLILLVMTPAIKKHNKMIAHIAVLVTLVVIIALCSKPLPAALERGGVGVFRVGAMILTSAFAMAMFVKSFIDARKAREAAEA
jgi:hypothetical protein